MTLVLLWIQQLVTNLRVQSPSLLALVTGNCLIIKPSPFAPLGTLKFGELAQEVLPPGVLSVLSGNDEL
jgi:acyl-CoA reductase-like NAD-dependent aldehyde dehydrogenase